MCGDNKLAKGVQRSSESAALLRDKELQKYAMTKSKVHSNSMSSSMLSFGSHLCHRYRRAAA